MGKSRVCSGPLWPARPELSGGKAGGGLTSQGERLRRFRNGSLTVKLTHLFASHPHTHADRKEASGPILLPELIAGRPDGSHVCDAPRSGKVRD